MCVQLGIERRDYPMYLKTTSPQFLSFGRVTDLPSRFDSQRHQLEDKSLQFLNKYNCPVRIEVLEGIGILVLDTGNGKLEQFVIHRAPIIDAGTPYVVIPLTQSVLLEVSFQTKNEVVREIIEVPGNRKYEPIKSSFEVTDIYSYYYNVKGKDYSFSGESHFYWELTYVDTGAVVMTVDGTQYTLEAQEMMIFFPGQFHKQQIEGNNSSSYLTVMFDMNVDWHSISHLKNRVVECTHELYDLMNKFIRQTTIFEADNNTYTRDLVVITFKEIILNMIRIDENKEEKDMVINPIQSQFENELLNEINNYIQKNIYEPISVEDICNHFAISRSTLQSLFKKHVSEPPKKYINELKMGQAQRLILEGNHSITEVALKLGFSSIHYFSRKFKTRFGLAPSEYLQSVYKISDDKIKGQDL